MQTKATLNLNAKDRTGHLPAVMPIDFPTLEKELKAAFEKQDQEQKEQPKRVVKNHAPGAK